MIRYGIVAACLAALSLSATVSAPLDAQLQKTAVVPGWRVDPARSRLSFAAAMNGQGFNGQFRRWGANIRFDPAHLDASSVRVVVATGSAATGDATRDEALPTADWFAVALFPRATFASRGFASLGGDRYRVDGDLILRNVSRPVSIPFQLVIQGNAARMVGRVGIDRTAFGVGEGQFKGTDTVAAKVGVIISITATKTP
jgi:polyisoprenoid-binding protein YceI